WRLDETLLTGAAAVCALFVHGELFGGGPLVVIKTSYLAVAAVLIGLLAEHEKSRRDQAATIGELLAGIQAQRGFRLARKYVASALLRLTESAVFLVAAREVDSNRAVLWSVSKARNGSILLTSTDLSEDRRSLFFFFAEGEGWSIVRRRRDTCSITAIDKN